MKKLVKKMMLNRETLRVLDADHLEEVAGGISVGCPPTVSCDTCRRTCDTCIPCV